MSRTIAIAVLIALAAPAARADMAEAVSAYDRKVYATTLKEFRPNAERGYENAQTLLGEMYWKGRGVPRSPVDAVEWLTRAAKQGDASAQARLGHIYFDGAGWSVPRNDELALKWLTMSADPRFVGGWMRGVDLQVRARAVGELARIYAEGRGRPVDLASAGKWLRVAAWKFAGDDNERRRLLRRLKTLEKGMTAPQLEEARRQWRIWSAEYRKAAEAYRRRTAPRRPDLSWQREARRKAIEAAIERARRKAIEQRKAK